MPDTEQSAQSSIHWIRQTPIVLRYLLIAIGAAAIYLIPWMDLFRLACRDDQYSHIILMPFITLGLIYLHRKRIFDTVRPSPKLGLPIAVVGIGCCLVIKNLPSFAVTPYYLSVLTAGGLIALGAGFVACCGSAALYRAAFPLSLLVLMIPVPAPFMSPIVLALQNGSAVFCSGLFKLLQVPAMRQDLTLSLPGFDIQIAQQCSGIRSSIALCIASALAGHLFLRSWRKKVLLVLITIPLVVFKNAVRIVTIAMLGIYVDRGFLYGALHHYSGLPFSLLEIAILAPLFIRWHRSDRLTSGNSGML